MKVTTKSNGRGSRTTFSYGFIGTFAFVASVLTSPVLGFSPSVVGDAPINRVKFDCKTKLLDSSRRNPHWKQAPRDSRKKTKCRNLLVLRSENDNSEREQGQLNSKKSVARTGGRKARDKKLRSNDNNTTIAFLRQWAAPLLIVALVLRFLFGGIFFQSSNVPNYVYYSRSVYQSTTYSTDGKLETKRKETFQSNIPGLVERSKDRETQTWDSALDDELVDIKDEIFNAFNLRSW